MCYIINVPHLTQAVSVHLSFYPSIRPFGTLVPQYGILLLGTVVHAINFLLLIAHQLP